MGKVDYLKNGLIKKQSNKKKFGYLTHTKTVACTSVPVPQTVNKHFLLDTDQYCFIKYV